ncbi:MAG: tRNA uridine-5-carboxymethylaminomethyl(34) synthesis GTPase MnmE [Gammaproteobacteria bacterium]|nr:tRNA uridine-5-carboxymethylaminomethyl(34) synthesis GTPase MnmE [Gammaproteobacteria bacterium]
MPAEPPTIAAIATAPGRGAVGIVRLSGPASSHIAVQLAGSLPPPRLAALRALRAPSGPLIDQGLCLFFPAPASYTGEDMVELQAHGGPAVLRELLNACCAAGARQARPGEFTERAFLNGKLDLLQAEAVASLIESSSAQAARAAARACAGDFSQAVAGIAQQLIALRVRLEAEIDFADDTPELSADADTAKRFASLRRDLQNLLAQAFAGARLAEGVEVAILGLPNTGKSTLLNRLCGEDRAIVTPLAGTTRDVLSVDVDVDGVMFRLADTAGLRDTDDLIEQEGVRRARARALNADLIIHVISAEALQAPDPPEILAALARGQSVLRVINKIDLVDASAPTSAAVAGAEVWISALLGQGIPLLRAALLAAAGLADIGEVPFTARARHVRALEKTAQAIAEAETQFSAAAIELACEHLRLAHALLEELTGVYTTEDLLGAIFATFCIGK